MIQMFRDRRPMLAVVAALLIGGGAAKAAEGLRVGFGKADVTPEVGEDAAPVYIAGYGNDRKATGVHDPLYARAVVLEDGDEKIALVSVDAIGIQYEVTLAVRERLGDYAYVLVSSTHDHEAPDVIGLWGPSRTESGVDPAYLELLEARIVAAVRDAESNLTAAEAAYGTAEDEALVSDSRLPKVKDGVLRALRFTAPGGEETVGLLVQWNCHPENLGSRNTLLTADFPYATVAALETRHECPVAYFTGAIGGLMSAPEDLLKAPDGSYYKEGDYAFAEAYGVAVADLADEALEGASPIALTPIAVAAETPAVPLGNNYYRIARATGVLGRMGYTWTGEPYASLDERPGRDILGPLAIRTEVAYLRLGDLHVAAIPGELYPELVYGEFQDPAEPNADEPDAAAGAPGDGDVARSGEDAVRPGQRRGRLHHPSPPVGHGRAVRLRPRATRSTARSTASAPRWRRS